MNRFDEFLYRIISAKAGRSLIWDDVAVFLADFLLYFLILGAIFFFASERRWKNRWFMFLEACLATVVARGIVTELIQRFYIHPRPFALYGTESLVTSLGNSFPSGHMTFTFALATVIFFHNRIWGGWYFAAGLLMGFARIFAGVHWPLDVIGGILIGSASAFLVHRILTRSREPKGTEPLSVPNSGSPA